MDRNGNGSYPNDLEDEGISRRQEVPKGLGQILGVDASVESENQCVDELSDANTFRGAEEEITNISVVGSTNEQLDACSFDRIDDENASSDVGSTHGVDYQMTNSLQQSLVLEITQSKESSVSSSPRARKVLDHCITAPVGTCKNLLSQSHEFAFSRSMTEKRGSPRPDLKLDRLSEAEKENLIVNLVKIQNDGTVEVDLTKNARVASELLELRSFEGPPSNIDFITSDFNKSVPKLKIAMLVVGTRGDIQPFLAVAKRLQEFGHQVRLATHINFSTFVKSAGIDFYPLGGDPRILAGYMAKNKGFIPSAPGDISIQRKQLKAIIESLLPACTEPDTESGEPFRAQAIIANPPAYGHTHVAEALGVPLHILFTMPWTPTYEFPHPLARVPQSAGYWLSYIVVDLLIWWSIRGYINDFRKRKLKLDPIAYFSLYNGSISHLPTAYMWSPNVMPKPSDPKKTTDIILEALKNTGQRGIIDRGWGNLGTLPEIPDSVFPLVDCPHDWLFPQCLAVVHHGGAGTTATGIRAWCPTTIVPFFGDQFFWGDRIHEKGLGPAPIPISELTFEALSDAIKFMLQPEVKSRAMEIAKLIENEDGVAAAVDAFHRHLPPEIPLSRSLSQEDDHPGPLQWLFIQIGKLCCLPCGS